MSEERCAVAVDQVDVLVSVGIPYLRARGLVGNYRIDDLFPQAAEALHRARVRKHFSVLLRQLFGLGSPLLQLGHELVEVLTLTLAQTFAATGLHRLPGARGVGFRGHGSLRWRGFPRRRCRGAGCGSRSCRRATAGHCGDLLLQCCELLGDGVERSRSRVQAICTRRVRHRRGNNLGFSREGIRGKFLVKKCRDRVEGRSAFDQLACRHAHAEASLELRVGASKEQRVEAEFQESRQRIELRGVEAT